MNVLVKYIPNIYLCQVLLLLSGFSSKTIRTVIGHFHIFGIFFRYMLTVSAIVSVLFCPYRDSSLLTDLLGG